MLIGSQNKNLRFQYNGIIIVNFINTIALYVFDLNLNSPIRWVLCLITLFFVFSILFFEVKSKNKIQAIFSVRLFLWIPMSSFLSLMGNRAVHGFEYWNFTTTTLGVENRKSNLSFIFFTFVASLVYICWDPQIASMFNQHSSSAFSIFFESIFLGAVILHAYVDRHLFKMRNPLTRELIGENLYNLGEPIQSK